MKKVWIMAAALVLVLGAAGYTMAQSTGAPQGGMMGQPLSPEQLEQFAKQHGITVDQAKQMTDACHQMMGTTTTPEAPKQ